MATTSGGDPRGGAGRDTRPFRPGHMPVLFGDTTAALIVDDDAQLAEVLGRLLSREGYRCTLAANAAEARARLTEQSFSLALVDVMMPRESGLELAADMLADHPDLAVVMVTAVDDAHVAELALQSGAYGYVIKPFRPSQILITVANAGWRRCLEIERREYERRLELRLDEQGTDLDDALVRLKQATGQNSASPEITTKFRGLVEAAPDAIVAVDTDGVIGLVNAQTERLFGYDRDELIGQNVELLVPEHARSIHPERRSRYVSDPQPRPMGAGMELAGRRKDGTEFPAEISLSAIDTDEGLLVSAAIRDVSDRKRAEAKFRGLLEAAPDAIVGVGADGTIALVNAQAERLFGYRRDELEGHRVEILVPEAARAVHPSRRAGYFAEPTPRPMGAGMQLAGRRKDGSEFPAEISLSAIETEEGLLVSAAVRDVTERIEAQAERERLTAQADRERLESQLHQSQRLESLGQLAGGVAHDFNNLLGAIINYASFVGEEIASAANAEPSHDWGGVQRDIAQIQRAADRAAQLTHQLLAFARREVVRPQLLIVNDVVNEVEQLLRRTIGEHVELEISAGQDLWGVLADKGQIEQVLVNLAVNARDAMPNGGKLSIETTNVMVDETYAISNPGVQPGRHMRLRVSDTGAGMDSEVLQRAFEPFFTTKPKGEGSGLGLATVYGIVSQSGGVAHIYSEPNMGMTFTALLPAAEGFTRAADQHTEHHAPGGGEAILVVEDEEGMREVTQRILARNGYQVLTASNGPAAITLATDHDGDIDLLITDVVMPKMLGKEVAERISALRPEVRVLFMSGYAQPVLGAHGTLEEGVTLVEKPFSERTLLARVREVLDAPAPVQ